MDALERAIRTALTKGDADDRAFRERVYRSAFAALERGLADPAISPETADLRRQGMKSAIARVEREFVSQAATIRPDPEMRMAPRPVGPERPTPSEPRLDGWEAENFGRAKADAIRPRRDEFSIDSDLDENVVGETRVVRRRRRPFAWAFILLTLIAVVALVWWAIADGLFLPVDQRDGAVPNPSTIEPEGFDPESAAPRQGTAGERPNPRAGAVMIFEPSADPEISVPAGARVEPADGENGAFLKITSGEAGAAIPFPVDAERLRQLAGRRVLFLIDARAEEGSPTQISVTCDFGSLGDCGRQRYEVGNERGEFIFDVDLPSVAPDRAGSIAIVSDVGDGGKALDLYAISASTP